MTEPELLNSLHNYFPFGFPISRQIWQWLEVGAIDKAGEGSAKIDTYTLRRLADRYNDAHYHSALHFEPLHAGQLISLGIIVDIWRFVAGLYCYQENPRVITRGVGWTSSKRGDAIALQPPPAFVEFFPPASVLRGAESEERYLEGSSDISSHREMINGEMIFLSLSIGNPAFAPFRQLFDDDALRQKAPYLPLVQSLELFFETQPPFSPLGMTLFKCLRAPIEASPDSLEGQLEYIKKHWGGFLPAELLERLLLASDILKEERQMRGYGPGPIQALRFGHYAYGYDLNYPEPAAFSHDADWMSNVVLIAKSTYVWLDQLSKKYQRHIRYLSDIPDEELDLLAKWGFTGLWLIGVWERSTASQKIKQITGNPEAAPSAYSIYDYVVSHDLGGDEALRNLHERAWRRRIRLASDMVPNHMGIYSRWIIEHPEWFVQLPYPPFPCYQFSGADLSWDERVGLYIEDGYWDRRDAAVVFKRVDRWTGDVRYIYHGNDGTSTPWNDTAQLNFLIPEVREAVIQMILHVARQFPIIRFDAAMTLAKRHYHRLWFPAHGEGGAIPSRAEQGLSKPDFDAVFPKEFWREVVDRVSAEVPETLLLAEAFWLMEGYFVRTLGMHRVYNSAFMNMLKMEDNAKYRTTIKNVLEFSPEVIKRFVNFMNNPDERTAVDQFGRGDKYFGVAMMMVTMPGLPMFGHGQIEGLTEKYGMEYRRAYWDETPDQEMIRRHEREIFPVMRHRSLFSGAANFALYDFVSPEGWVDENVFAYSNRAGEERGIILYNNAYNMTRGTIQASTQINIGNADQPQFIRRTLSEALGLNVGDNIFYAFHDYATGLDYMREARQMESNGLYAELRAYQYHAFLDFREIHDSDGSWRRLAVNLNGGGVTNLQDAYREMVFEPILSPLARLLDSERIRRFAGSTKSSVDAQKQEVADFIRAVKEFVGSTVDAETITKEFYHELSEPGKEGSVPSKSSRQAVESVASAPGMPHIILAFCLVRMLGRIPVSGDTTSPNDLALRRFHEWPLFAAIRRAFEAFLGDGSLAHHDTLLLQIKLANPDLLRQKKQDEMVPAFRDSLGQPAVQEYLLVNRYNDILWLSKERLERLVEVLVMTSALPADSAKVKLNSRSLVKKNSARLLVAAAKAGYKVDEIIKELSISSGKKPPARKRRSRSA